MAEDEDKGLLGKATDEIGKAAAKHAAKAAFDEASRRAKQAFEGVIGSAEGWVGQEAASAEARREASGLPDTEPGPHWTDALAEEGEAAFERARAHNPTLVDEESDEAADEEARQAAAHEAAARKARAQEQLARMKAALAASQDPLLAEARRGRTAVPIEAPEPDPTDTLDAELEAMAAAAAADAGSIVPDDASEAPAPREEPVVEDAPEDPAMAILARARAARAAASDEPLEAVEQAAPELEHDPAPMEPVEDPALAALAASRAARGAVSRGAEAGTEEVRAAARARIAAIEAEAWDRSLAPPPSADELGLPPPPSTPVDPMEAAEATLARARAARVDAGTAGDPLEAARAAARARIAAITASAEAEADATAAAPHLPARDDDPFARARAALESAAGSRGSDDHERAQNLARARAQLRAGSHRKSAEELAREAIAGFTGPNAEQLAADALAASAEVASRQEAIAEKARRQAQEYAEAIKRRADAAQADIQARVAGRTAYATAVGTPEERTQAALEASAAARALASGQDPAKEAARRVELDRLKRAREAREQQAETPARAGSKSDLLGSPAPTLVPTGEATPSPEADDHGDDDEGADVVPKRSL